MRYGLLFSALLPTLLLLLGCAALESLAALQQVRFEIGGVSNGVLAGVDLDRVRRLEDLRAGQLLSVADAYRRGSLPLRFTLHLDATNPSTNDLDAALERLDWRLFLNGRETVSGIYDRQLRLPAGRTVDLPLRIDLDLLELYRDSRDDLIQLALQVAGADAEPQRLELRATPTVTTALGPIRYPGEIVIRSR